MDGTKLNICLREQGNKLNTHGQAARLSRAHSNTGKS